MFINVLSCSLGRLLDSGTAGAVDCIPKDGVENGAGGGNRLVVGTADDRLLKSGSFRGVDAAADGNVNGEDDEGVGA